MLKRTTIWSELENKHKTIYYFDSPVFMLDGTQAEIIETISTGPTWKDVDHILKWKDDYTRFSINELISLKTKGRLV